MGTDIDGWVEFRMSDDGTWFRVIELSALLYRDYDLFGCLFGVRNFARFRPLFAERGLPEECSLPVSPDAYGETWATFAELQAIDMSELAEDYDERIHEFRVEADGREVYEGKASYSHRAEPHREAIIRDGEARDGNLVFRRVRLRRGDVLRRGAWATLVRMMAVLAEEYGAGNVRVVVWFDD